MQREARVTLSRWKGPVGTLAYRRWVILSAGLRQMLSLRFFQWVIGIAWLAGIAVAALGFLFAQTVANGGWLDTLSANLGPRVHALFSTLGGFVLLYPEICIRALFTTLFWLQSFVGAGLSLVALTVLAPRLIARDRASHALTVYLSRPLTTADYLMGKLGTIAGVLALLWTGPLLLGWLLSTLFAPDRDFLVYSFGPLLRALVFNGIGLVVLASVALGVSAVARSSRTTIILWLAVWLVAGAIAKPPGTFVWVRRASFSHDLSQVREAVFQLDDVLTEAGTELPILSQSMAADLTRAGQNVEPADLYGSLAGLGFIVALSSLVFLRKLRAE
jgi:ABC-type transport system involved in multi-copper enzyme maturation permease subunit